MPEGGPGPGYRSTQGGQAASPRKGRGLRDSEDDTLWSCGGRAPQTEEGHW